MEEHTEYKLKREQGRETQLYVIDIDGFEMKRRKNIFGEERNGKEKIIRENG